MLLLFLRRARFCTVICFFFLLATATAVSAQSQATITSSTELVLIPTVVNDKSASHISGLKKEDFVLKQDGKTQPIAIFEEVKTDTTRLHRSQGEHGTFTNLEPGGSEYHRLSIIVLDFINTPFADQSTARVALLKFLSEVADSGEPMCLLALTSNGLNVLHDFTDDPKALAAALNQAKGNSSPMIHETLTDSQHPVGDALAVVLTALMRGTLQNEAQLASLESKTAVSITLQALQQIAKAFRGLPGRKSLIWASSGFPFSLQPASAPSSVFYEPDIPLHGRDEVQSSYDNVWRLMNDAQISIYSVDLRTSNTGTFMTTGGVRPYDMGDPQFDTDAQARDQKADTNSTLQTFAENTGGKAFLGGGNLIQSFRQAVEDDKSYYMLGYYVSPKNTKPGWHGISVTAHAKGSHIRYRNGFFLSRDASTPTAQQDIRLALNSPLDYTGMPLSLTWAGKEAGISQGKLKIQFELVMPANFASVDRSDANHMVVDIAAVARDSKGSAVADLAQRIDVHLKADGLEQIQHNGMTYRNRLQLPPGEYNVRFVVRDSVGNRTGSVAAPLSVSQ